MKKGGAAPKGERQRDALWSLCLKGEGLRDTAGGAQPQKVRRVAVCAPIR